MKMRQRIYAFVIIKVIFSTNLRRKTMRFFIHLLRVRLRILFLEKELFLSTVSLEKYQCSARKHFRNKQMTLYSTFL